MTSKEVTIPRWANGIALLANSIDGLTPPMPDRMSVEEFIASAEELQKRNGQGEWVVIVYAVSDPNEERGVRHPYGADNPYRTLRSYGNNKVIRLASFSYMRWLHYSFTKET